MNFKRFGAVALVASVMLGACGSQKTELKLNFEKGKQYEYNYAVDLAMSVGGMETKTLMDFNYVMQASPADAGNTLLATNISHIKMKVDAGAMKLELDTDHPVDTAGATADPMKMATVMMNKVFGGLVNKPIDVTVDAKGALVSVKGYNEMITGILDSVAKDSSERAKMKATLDQQLNDDNLKSSFGQMFNIYPDHAVGKGDSWNRTLEMKGQMPMKMDMTYKVKEVKADVVVLDVTGKLTTLGSGEQEIQGQKIKMEVDGTITGTMDVDTKSGMLHNGVLKQDLKMKMNGAMTIDVKGNTTIKGTVH